LSWIRGATLQLATASNDKYITLEDVQTNAVLSSVNGKVPTKIIVLENTIGGIIVPLDEVRKISIWAREHEIRVHMDGARLWHAAAELGGPTLRDYCELCDSVALDFSKAICAPGGTMLVADGHTIKTARQLRKPMGTIGQLGILTSAAEAAFKEQFGLGILNGNSTIRDLHIMTRRVARMWTDRGGSLVKPTETNMIWLDLPSIGLDREEFNETAKQFGIKSDGQRLVLHQQVSEEAIQRLGALFDCLLK
jgi:threonine aldolase